MCLYAKKGSARTAETDIHTYKVVNRSPDNPKQWSPLFVTGMYDTDTVLDAGGCDEDAMPYMMLEYGAPERTICVGKGFFHSTVSSNKRFELLTEHETSSVCRATIPAGSKYYKDDDGNYASDKIIVHSDWF